MAMVAVVYWLGQAGLRLRTIGLVYRLAVTGAVSAVTA